jgi:hypothetical protein
MAGWMPDVIGIFAMRWNVVIGGQLFSKSFLGYTTYKMAFATREGLVDRDRAHDSSFCHSVGSGETPATLAGVSSGARLRRRSGARNQLAPFT